MKLNYYDWLGKVGSMMKATLNNNMIDRIGASYAKNETKQL